MAVTPEYGETLPTPGASADVWGDENNDLHLAWDAALASPTNTIKGRTTAGTGPHENLTPTQITAMLNPAASALKGLVPASAGASDVYNPLSGDGTFKKKIACAAGGYLTVTGSAVTLEGGSFGVTSAVWSNLSTDNAQVTVTLASAMPNSSYRVSLGYELASGLGSPPMTGILFNKTTTQFVIVYDKTAHRNVSFSVFEG